MNNENKTIMPKGWLWPFIALCFIVILLYSCALKAQTVALPKASTSDVVLTWDAPVSSPDPVAGYNAYRSPSGAGSYAQLNVSTVTVLTYTDQSVPSSTTTTYDYIVKSVDAAGVTSTPSNTANIGINFIPAPFVIGKPTST
jgi:hypothetical protein